MNSLPKSAARWARVIILAFFISGLVFTPVRADVAPPESPPGTNIVPGNNSTQVRMLAERVTMTVISRPLDKVLGQAKTEAAFLMRNMGTAAENIEVRFPLTFFDGRSDGFGGFPEIADIQITVNGKPVSTRRIISNFFGSDGKIYDPSPWAAFNVNFPAGQDVPITVTYTTRGYGYQPYFALRYVLETGAGWNGTIGTADVIVRLPYEANAKNIMLDETTGFSQTTPGAQFIGNEIRWHFDDFEPTSANNIEISILQMPYWQKVLDEIDNTTKNPSDGEAWGRLGKAYKEIINLSKFFRGDPAGLEMYQLSIQAYEKAVTMLPNDALWHYGFADLLWSHHYLYHYASDDTTDLPELVHAADEIRKSLTLDPQNENARQLASSMASQYPWAVGQTDKGYDFLILTATPTYAPQVVTETPATDSTFTPLPPKPSATILATKPPLPTMTPVKVPASGTPFCGGTALFLPLLAGLVWALSKRS